jgi:hypothetical protein
MRTQKIVNKTTMSGNSKLKWKNLGKPLSPPVLNVITDVLNFQIMTPVQVSPKQSLIPLNLTFE